MSATGNISIGGSSISTVWQQFVHTGVSEPEFPTIDPSVYEPYATNIINGNPSGKNFSNIRIKANTNPSFAGNTTIKGVMFIETPNRIRFTGNCTIQGVIVVQANPTGDLSSNQLSFTGNVNASGPETLPASYGDLRTLTGASSSPPISTSASPATSAPSAEASSSAASASPATPAAPSTARSSPWRATR